MDLGNRIQTLRKGQGMSQEELADQLGLSRQAIGKWESGGAFPSIDNLMELAALFHTTVDYLLTGREPESPLACDAGPEHVSMDALRTLLAEYQTPHRKRLKWCLMALGGVCAVLVLVLLGYYITRLGALEDQVSGIQSSVGILDSQL